MSSGDTASGSRGPHDVVQGRPDSFTSKLHPTGAELLSAIAAGQLPQHHAAQQQNGGASGGGQHPGVDNGVAKRTKEQEKNRRAQARFRERQKLKHGETERRMNELEAAVKQLQVERDALAIKADTLERCLLQGDPADTEGLADGRNGKAIKASFAQYVDWYKGQVQQLAPLLVQAQFDMNSEAGRKISDIWGTLVKEGVMWYRDESIRTRVYSQPILHEGESQPARPDKALWKQVTAALQLTDFQQERCRSVRAGYLSAMAAIMTERQAVNMAMQEMPQCDANIQVALHTANALDAVAKLQANLKKEQVLQSEMSIEVFERILTPIQAATAFVGLYPWAPDKLAMLDCACSGA